jgi:hypothetical protein
VAIRSSQPSRSSDHTSGVPWRIAARYGRSSLAIDTAAREPAVMSAPVRRASILVVNQNAFSA